LFGLAKFQISEVIYMEDCARLAAVPVSLFPGYYH